ncbi:MFS general substrate transporter, partial [Rozella allomycis CSF55]
MAFLATTTFVFSPFWAFINDKLRSPRLLLSFATVLQGMSFFSFLLIPRYLGDYTFYFVLLVAFLINCFNAALYPVTDKLVLSELCDSQTESNNKQDGKKLYGRQRLFGTFGDASTKTLMAILIQGFFYERLFVGVGITMTIFISFILLGFPNNQNSEKEKTDPEANNKKLRRELDTFEAFKTLLCNKNLQMFMIISIANGISRSIGSHYFDAYVEDPIKGLNGSKLWVSIAGWSSCVCEVFFFLISRNIAEKFGISRLLLFAQISMLTRMTTHSLNIIGTGNTVNLVLACFGELFKGISFGCMMAGGVLVASKEAPKELQTTAQGLFSGIYNGLSPAVAGVIGWILLKNSEGSFLYGYTGCFKIAMLLSIISVIMAFVLDKKITKHECSS